MCCNEKSICVRIKENYGEIMKEILDKIILLKDDAYGDFQARLTPTIKRENFIGVRVPLLRSLAKELSKNSEISAFFDELPHRYYDENMLHGLLIAEIKDFDKCVAEVNKFLPYIDNWAVCDILSPKVFAKNKAKLMEYIKGWIKSNEVYTCRFGIEMLMSFYLDKDFLPEYLQPVVEVKGEDYYVKMMVAWFFTTALTKQWDSSIAIIEQKLLSPWIHNKTIQKAIESYRITDEQKDYLRKLKI